MGVPLKPLSAALLFEGTTPVSPSPDPSLAARAPVDATGRHARLEGWFHDHFDTLWRLAVRLGVPDAHVDDVVQEAFIVADRRADEIERGSERGFLIGIVVRASANQRMAEPNSPAATRAGVHPPDEDAPLASDRFERALFDSARADDVPRQARERVALALGVAMPPAGALQGAPGEMMCARTKGLVANDGPRAASAGAEGAIAPAGKLAFAGKCALVVVAGGLAALALGRSNHASAPAGAVSAPLAAPALVAQPDGRRHAASAPPASADDHAAKSPRPRDAPWAPKAARPRQRSPRAPETAGESRLLAEVARLDQARAALAAADAPLVLHHVRRYRAEFPNGVLAREAARLDERGRALEGGSTAPRRDIEQAR